jgi:hypothetical protein
MKTAGKAATIAESHLLSGQNAANEDAATYEQEGENQIEQDNVERASRDIASVSSQLRGVAKR